MNLIFLEEKIDNIKKDLEEIKNELEKKEEELKDNKVYFKQAKEIENTIDNLKKNGLPVPEELINLKLDLLDKKRNYQKMINLKEEYESLSKFFSKSDTKKFIRDMSYSRKNSGNRKFILFGNEYKIKFWYEIILILVDVLYKKNPSNIHEIFKIKGKSRPYFSKNPDEIRAPKYLEEPNVYCETNLSFNRIILISKEILKLFGFSPNDLEVKDDFKEINN
jgi:hypothetical protein